MTGVQVKGAGDGAGDLAPIRVNGSSEEMEATKKTAPISIDAVENNNL